MEISLNTFLYAFGLTLIAGLSTGIGSLLAFYTKETNQRVLTVALGFSAGVMIYVSMIEIFAKAKESLIALWGQNMGYLATVIAFFVGIGLIAAIDKFVPSAGNPHERRDVQDMQIDPPKDAVLLRIGLFSALAVGIHNFPEGIATFISAIEDPNLGISIAVAVAIHNIPEGIAVSVPLFFATGSRRKAFGYSFLSGLAEPVGAVVGYLLLLTFFTEAMFGLVFAAVAGIMVYISLDELLPTAEKYGEHHIAIYGLIAGMAVMAFSLVLVA